MVVAASAMRVLVVDSSAGSAVTGFVGMVKCEVLVISDESCGECNYNAQTQSVDGQWLSVGSAFFNGKERLPTCCKHVHERNHLAGKTDYQIYMGTSWEGGIVRR